MMVTGMGLSSTAGYDVAKDFAPIGTIASIPIVVMAIRRLRRSRSRM